MVLGHWDADPFDNYKPRRQDNRRNSGSTHQNHYYQKYNSESHSYPKEDIVKDKTTVKCLKPPSFEKKIEEDKTASECLNPPLSKDQSLNFTINNELKECNEYRLKHLNEEEKENLKNVLFEYNNIQ